MLIASLITAKKQSKIDFIQFSEAFLTICGPALKSKGRYAILEIS